MLLDLAPHGVCLADPVTCVAGELLPHHFTHHRGSKTLRLVYFLLHVPSPLARRLPVRKHDALWSSDFPHLQKQAR